MRKVYEIEFIKEEKFMTAKKIKKNSFRKQCSIHEM